jgi:hypothetical protein
MRESARYSTRSRSSAGLPKPHLVVSVMPHRKRSLAFSREPSWPSPKRTWAFSIRGPRKRCRGLSPRILPAFAGLVSSKHKSCIDHVPLRLLYCLDVALIPASRNIHSLAFGIIQSSADRPNAEPFPFSSAHRNRRLTPGLKGFVDSIFDVRCSGFSGVPGECEANTGTKTDLPPVLDVNRDALRLSWTHHRVMY